MLSHLTTVLLLLPLGTLSAAVTVPSALALEQRAVSPNKTCGASNSGYTCPADAACCSQYGYCGSTEAFCLTTANCQARYSNSSSACYAPRPGVSISIDGTCGTTGAGKNGYRCAGNATVISCCSAAGYCGTTSDHCDAAKGCQAGFGNCTGRAGTKTSRNLFGVEDMLS
ncbi:carbohydrate-binding module family 18 protein [Achaetomium macrosporum]|uniref:Carbohydrate-binding module family 18 protein n=1 Tax=Achaetomium macrosporum TaxID=79813 RepID=A0AAN7CCX0_9PEZI|nr:carbohydrate-binding module family 18 protein [Achaetomium macrosporum]